MVPSEKKIEGRTTMRATLRLRLGYLRLRRFSYLRCAFLALPFLALAAWMQMAEAQSPSADTVKIGLIMTYPGQFTDGAAQMDNGIKLYISSMATPSPARRSKSSAKTT